MSLNFSEYNSRDYNRQMARRMDRKVIKLEAAYGSERQFIVVTRGQDLVVRDVMEDIQKVFKIPIDQQVIFHKGANLCDYLNEKLENLGVENNHPIRITRDPDLPSRSPRAKLTNQMGSRLSLVDNQINKSNSLDPVSYLKEISPQRVPDPTPFQVQMYNQNMMNHQRQMLPQGSNDVIKLYVSFGSEREYILVYGKKPILVNDLKQELQRIFKIPADQQCIVFRGYNIHEYLDDAPLEAFGLENNSPISLWPKSTGNQPDIRLPRGQSPQPNNMADIFSPRVPNGNLTNRWSGPSNSDASTEVLKVEVQHGSDRHLLLLKGLNKNLTVLDLQNEIERITAVTVRDQKLYFKSQELNMTPFKTLKDCELENNNSVKLVGDPSKLRYSNYFGRMQIPMSNQSQSNSQLSNYQPNYLPQQIQQQQQQQPTQNFNPLQLNYNPQQQQQQIQFNNQQMAQQQQQQQQQQTNFGYQQNF